MSVPLRRQYDMTLTIGGKDYGYQLWEDPQGQKHWNEGLAPLITPQQRITEFSYEHIPPEIDMPAAFENWSSGAGATEFLSTTATSTGFYQLNSNTPKTYNYSQGVDASWDNRLYLSPARVADLADSGSDVAAAPTFFFSSQTFGVWCIASTYMYQYNQASGTWVLKKTATAAVTSMAELNGVLYASVTGAAYVYSTDSTGVAWTTYSDNVLNASNVADLFVVRNATILAMRSEKAYITTNGQNGGVAWSAGTAIGSSSETTKSLAVVNGSYWVFKIEGIYKWDGTAVTDVWHPKFLTSTNGNSAFVWYDGLIYTVYNSRILSIDSFNTTDATLQFIYPPEPKIVNITSEPKDSPELKGSISQITGTFNDLIFTVTNPQGNTYLMKGDPRTQVYHSLAYLGANTNAACLAAGAGTIHASNPVILTGYGRAAVHYVMPRSDLRPEDDTNYRYETTGIMYGPWMGYGARGFNKFLNRGTVLGTGITAGQNVTLGYQLDDNTTTTTTLVNAIDYGITSTNTSSTVSFYRIRFVMTLNGASTQTSPIVVAATLHATINPPRRRTWKPLIQLAPNLILRDGTTDSQDPTTLRNALYKAATSRITMTDRESNQFIVRVLDIQETQIKPYTEGAYESDSQVLQVTLAEITTVSTSAQGAKYGQAKYSQGYSYATV